MVSQPNSENQQNLISQLNQEISTHNLNCGWKLKRTHQILGQISPIIKSKMAAAAILKTLKR
jgi:hypothetical protein